MQTFRKTKKTVQSQKEYNIANLGQTGYFEPGRVTALGISVSLPAGHTIDKQFKVDGQSTVTAIVFLRV